MAIAKRRCRFCRQYKDAKTMLNVPLGKVCNSECAIALSRDQSPKTTQARRVLESKRNRADKRKLKLESLPHQKELTQRKFNEMIRLLDAGKNCPTCDEPLVDGMYDAGHVRTVAACPQLRYDARACFGQCRGCNGSGTIRKRTRKTQESVSDLYKAWILESFGQAYYDWLYGPHASPKWTIDQLEAMRKEFAEECRRIERGEEPSRPWRALPQQQEQTA